jgi:magnesium-transporting ATPase (P-type)
MIGALLIVIVSILIVVFITQLLWNFVMPEVFDVKKIEFLQTFALLILTGIFFGGHCNASSVYTMNNMVA